MTKGFVKRSSFQFVSLTDATVKTILVEGDEAYVTLMNTNGNQALLRRQSGRDFAKAAAANGGLAGGSTYLNEWEILDYLNGKVPLDVPNGFSNYLSNAPITMPASNATTVERIRSFNVGIKENIDIKANNATYPLNICIETVHYVPVDQIAA
ncbi:hypothetical protein [Spirosoma litoris]